VDLATTKFMLPSALHEHIRKENRAVFQYFIDYPKPIIIAMNG
jgi:hypothetical protein